MDLHFGVVFSLISLLDFLGIFHNLFTMETYPALGARQLPETKLCVKTSDLPWLHSRLWDRLFPFIRVGAFSCGMLDFLNSGFAARRSFVEICGHGHAVESALMPLRTRIWETGRTF